MQAARRGAGGDLLDHFQRDHLAGQLGEALEAAADVQEAVGVELDDVAGGVPAGAAGRRRLDDAGLVEQQVALHQVRSLHVQRAAVVDAGTASSW
ncbi:hypothetical protein D9M71_828680 [compost metagenome]